MKRFKRGSVATVVGGIAVITTGINTTQQDFNPSSTSQDSNVQILSEDYKNESSNSQAKTSPSQFEMPLVSERLSVNDSNGNRKLSAKEIELMPDRDAAAVFKYSIKAPSGERETVPIESAYEVLRELSTSKLTRVIDRITDLDLQRVYFNMLAADDFDRAVQVLFNAKEGPYDVSIIGEGSNADTLLDGVDAETRQKMLAEIKCRDPGYHANILDHDRRLEEWGNSLDSDLMQLDPTTSHWTPPGKTQRVVKPSTSIPQPSFSRRDTSRDDPNAIVVLQREYAITSADSKKTTLQTMGATTCVAITLYDTQNKLGALAHIDGVTKVHESFDRMIAELELLGANKSDLEARIIGGALGFSEELVYMITDRLTEADIPILETDILHYLMDGANIQLDVKTGKVTNYEEKINQRGDTMKYLDALTMTGRYERLSRHPDSLQPKEPN